VQNDSVVWLVPCHPTSPRAQGIVVGIYFLEPGLTAEFKWTTISLPNS